MWIVLSHERIWAISVFRPPGDALFSQLMLTVVWNPKKVKFRKVASFGTEWSKVYWIKNPNKVDFRLFNSLDYCAFFAHYVSPCSLFYALLANYYIYQYKVMIYHTNCDKNYLFHFWTSAFEKKCKTAANILFNFLQM